MNNLSTAYKRKFNSLYRGVVEDNIDPKNLGRCRVRVPSIHGSLRYPPSSLPWARPLVLSSVSKGRGSVCLPDIGDIVWVLFEGDDREFPIYFGGTYAQGELDIDYDTVVFYTEDGNKISYNRKTKTYEIVVGDSKVSIDSQGIRLEGDISISGTLKVNGREV